MAVTNDDVRRAIFDEVTSRPGTFFCLCTRETILELQRFQLGCKDRTIDRALQWLRKRGLIRFVNQRDGWAPTGKAWE